MIKITTLIRSRMLNLVVLSLTFFMFIQAHSQVQVGTGQTYTTLKAAFDAINDGTLTGDVVLEIAADCNEGNGFGDVAELQASGVGAASYTSVLIYPTGGTRTISTNSTSRLIDLNGADNVTIDGRLNGSGAPNSLIIENLGTDLLSTALTIRGGAIDNTVQYTVIRGSANDTGIGKIIDIGGIGTAGTNSGNIIQYNEITSASSGSPASGLFSGGTGINSSTTIRGNSFYDLGIENWLHLTNNTQDWTIIDNSFYQTTPLTVNESISHTLRFIYILNDVTDVTIQDNYFGGSAINAGGTAFDLTMVDGIFNCIDGQPDAGTITVIGNTFSNFDIDASVSEPFTAVSARGDATWIIGQVGNGNIFGSTTLDDAITITGVTAASVQPILVDHISSSLLSRVEGNTFGGITFNYNPASSFPELNLIALGSGGRAVINQNTFGTENAAIKLRGIGRAIAYKMIDWTTDADAEITNNTFQNFDITTTPDNGANEEAFIYFFGNGSHVVSDNTFGSATLESLTFDTHDDVHLIHIYSEGSYTVTNNIIQNVVQKRATSSAGLTPIFVDFFSNDASISITDNQIRDCSSASSNTFSDFAFTGIFLDASNITSKTLVANNTIENIETTGTGGLVGISVEAGGALVEKNFIHNIQGVASALYGINVGSDEDVDLFNNIVLIENGGQSPTIRGIMDNSSANKTLRVFHNTVKISGTATTGSTASNAFTFLGSNGSPDVRNNVFQNVRTNSGASGAHIAVRYSGNPTGTFDYNWMEASGTGGVFGVWNNSNQVDLAAFQTASGQAANVTTGTISIDVNGNVTDFAPENVQNTGVDIQAIVPDDFDTDAIRPSCPWMGAHEGIAYVPVFTVSITPSADVCVGGDVSFTVQLLDGANDPLGAYIVYSINGGGAQEVLTDVNGEAIISLTGVTVDQTITVSAIRIGACEYAVAPNEVETIAVNEVPTLSATGNNPLACGGDGSIDFSFTDVPDNTYTITYDGGQFDNVVVSGNSASVNVPAGVYNDLQISVSGCTSATGENVSLNDPSAPTLSATGNDPLACGGDGSIDFTFTDVPDNTYTITYDGGQFDNVVVSGNSASVNAPAGVYNDLQISVSGCTSATGENVSLNDPSAPTLSATGNDPLTCGGDGSIDFSFTDVPDNTYTITYDGGQFDNVVVSGNSASVNVPAGVYNDLQISVSGCTSSAGENVSLNDPSAPTLSATGNDPLTCGGDGSIDFTFTDVPDNTYTITYDGGQFDNVVVSGNSASVTAVAGNYTNLQIAVAGCTSAAGQSVSITGTPEPTLVVTSVVQPTICGGQGSISINVTNVIDGTYTVSYDGGNFTLVNVSGGSATISASAGTYDNLVIAYQGCLSALGESAILTDPLAPVISVNTVNSPSTCGGSDGEIVLDVVGANGVNYDFTHDAGTFTGVDIVGGVATIAAGTGTYTNLSFEENGCQSNSLTVEVEDPTSVTSTPVITPATPVCVGQDAIFDLVGTANNTVTYTLDNGVSTETVQLDALGEATITIAAPSSDVTLEIVEVTDNICTDFISETATVIIDQPSAPTVNCGVSTANSVTFEWTPVAGATGYTLNYEIEGNAQPSVLGHVTTSYEVTGLSPNDEVTIVVIPEGGDPCFQASTVVACQANDCIAPTITLNPTDIDVCANDVAVFEVTATNADNYQWQVSTDGGVTYVDLVNDVVYSGATTNELTINDVNGLNGNNYRVVIGDPLNACEVSSSEGVLTVLALPNAPTVTSNGPVCFGEDAIFTITGAINSTVTYTINGGADQTVVLAGGNAVVTVNAIDQNQLLDIVSIENSNCVLNTVGLTEEVIMNQLPASVTVSTNSPVCSGDDAIFTITGNPGDEVVYAIDGNQTSVILNGAGSADVTIPTSLNNVELEIISVTDGTCTRTIGLVEESVVVFPITPTISTNGPICSGEDAVFTLSGSPGDEVIYSINGIALFTTQIGAGGTVDILVPVVQNNQTITLWEVTDGVCTKTIGVAATISVQSGGTISQLETNTPICSGETALFDIVGTPGATVDYTINNGPVQSDVIPGNGTLVVQVNNALVDQSIEIISASLNGCVNSNVNLTASITVNTSPEISAVNATSPLTCGDLGEIDFTFNNLPDGTYDINYTGGQFSGVQVTSNTATVNTGEGTYSNFTVTTNGCSGSSSSSVAITVPDQPDAPLVTGTTLYCQGDVLSELTVEAEDGAVISWYTDAGLTNEISNSSNFTPLANFGTTTYYVTQTLDNCESNATIIQVTIQPTPAAPIQNSSSTFCTSDEVVEMFANGNLGGDITWYLDEDLITVYSTENFAEPLVEIGTTDYYVTETVNGCEGEPAKLAITFKNCDFLLPTAFTPDADGVNDSWLIPGLDEVYPSNKVLVFNRWGNLVYEHDSSKDGTYNSRPWDGTFKGKVLPVGSYFYIIEIGNEEKMQGAVSIILE